MALRARDVASVFRAAFSNPVLRRVGFAYAMFGAAEFGTWIGLLIFAYDYGGATASTLMVLIQLVPSIALGPFLGAITDRRRPSRVLCLSYVLQAVSAGGAALAIGTHAPSAVVFVLAPLTSVSFTMTRPPQAALLPAIVRTPDELTAASVMTGWTNGGAALVGPALVGLLLSGGGLGTALAVMAAMPALSALLVVSIGGPAAAVASDESSESIGTGTRSNLLQAARNPRIRVLLVMHTFYFVLIGALDVLCVILAVSYLHMGPGGPGFLNVALGGGALLAGFVSAFLVGQRHLAKTLIVTIAAAVVALALVGATTTVALVVVLIIVVGCAGAVFDITGRTLLQRLAPSDAIAGSFSILEALMDLGVALGAILVRVAIGIDGQKAAILAPAALVLVLLAALWRKLLNIDSSVTVPQVEIQLLRSIPIFAALPAPSLEGIARELDPVTVSAGTVVIKEGARGDCYYAVADGQLSVTRQGRFLQTVSRGEGFGEIALISDVPRQASVTAVTPAALYSLQKELFVQTVTGHAAAARAAGSIIAGHLRHDESGPADGPPPGATSG